MGRPTIKHLAQSAGLSIATVNRVLAGAKNVRQPTRERVQEAAERIGFYGLGTIHSRVAASRPRFRFGILLLQSHRPFYQIVAKAFQEAAAEMTEGEVELRIDYLEDLSPQNTAARALALAQDCMAICITTAVHPIVIDAVEQIQARGVPVFAFIAQLATTGFVHYIGIDNWKAGRTAAWTFEQVCKQPGKIGILLGNHRYRNQEMNEAGFRSYFREYAPGFTLLEAVSTFESAAVAQEVTEKLLRDHPDLVGLFIGGGGTSGAITALRDSDLGGRIPAIGYELFDATRAALLDGTLTLVISHPLKRLARHAIRGMVSACISKGSAANWTSVARFEIFTRENI